MMAVAFYQFGQSALRAEKWLAGERERERERVSSGGSGGAGATVAAPKALAGRKEQQGNGNKLELRAPVHERGESGGSAPFFPDHWPAAAGQGSRRDG